MKYQVVCLWVHDVAPFEHVFGAYATEELAEQVLLVLAARSDISGAWITMESPKER